MQGRSAESICRILAATALAAAGASHAAGADSIVKPPDGAWIQGEEIEIIAKAVEGRLLVNGEAVEAEEPFPGVLHYRGPLVGGRHTITLESADGSRSVAFRLANSPGDGTVQPYIDHPPVRMDCTHCHSVSRRGRFRFSGGCESCHATQQFIRTHSHEQHELSSCGMCHDAHGSSAAKLLVMDRERACKQCHN